MPVLFIGHGTPMNALADNLYTRSWRAIGDQVIAEFGKPKAIVMISAHWWTRGTYVCNVDVPETIHDFGAFPQALFDIRYPAPGHAALASNIVELLAPFNAKATSDWGMDHGAWSVLMKAFPLADIPVLQISIDADVETERHFEIGARLAALRDQGVLIIGSGNIVHNLRAVIRRPGVVPYDWAQRFNDQIKEAIVDDKREVLIQYALLGSDASMSVPSPDHYVPLLYTMGARDRSDVISFDTDQVEFGSLSMLSVACGMTFARDYGSVVGA